MTALEAVGTMAPDRRAFQVRTIDKPRAVG
jgi:hypothetical protein